MMTVPSSLSRRQIHPCLHDRQCQCRRSKTVHFAAAAPLLAAGGDGGHPPSSSSKQHHGDGWGSGPCLPNAAMTCIKYWISRLG